MEQTDRPTILIVEDEIELAETFARWLRPQYQVITANTAEAALKKMSDVVDVVLLDRRLPDRPGEEILELIRDERYGCRVAMITAVDPDIDILEMEFDDYIIKPVPQDELLDIVDRLLSLAEYDDRIKQSFALASKIAVLETEKSEQWLEDNEAYRKKKQELANLQEEIKDILTDFDSGTFAVAYRDLDR